MAKRDLPPVHVLRQLLSYDPETGSLTWRERDRSWFPSDRIFRSWNAKFAGKPALSYTDNYGYLRGKIAGQIIRAHIVIWTMVHGAPPTGCIDHINHDRADNRLSNLREITKRDNHLNMMRSSANTSGVTGVSMVKKRWQASICVNRKTIYLGRFDDIEDAARARACAERKYGFHENHGS